MPLYETIVIGRCSNPKGSANLLRLIAIAIMKEGGTQNYTVPQKSGNVRDMSVLGDRILANNVKGNDQKRHVIGRYLQVMYDGDEHCVKRAEEIAKESYETLRFMTHRMKDYYIEGQLFKKTLKEQSLIIDESVRNREYIQELTAAIKEKNFLKK